jgi:short-subunit dehydrogenase
VFSAFKQRNLGTLVNISSVLGFYTLPISSIYSGTKAYVLQLTRGLQEEAANTKVVVQLVMPGATATEIWDVGGVPLEKLDPAIVMTAENCVDAALQGLANGELITIPPVDNMQLWNQFEDARQKLSFSTQTGKPGSRYGL